MQGHELALVNVTSFNQGKTHVGDGRGMEGEEAWFAQGMVGEGRSYANVSGGFSLQDRGGAGDLPREAGCQAWHPRGGQKDPGTGAIFPAPPWI